MGTLDGILRDFEPDPKPKEKWKKIGKDHWESLSRKVDLPGELYLWHPFIAFIIFVKIKNYPFTGIDEKVAWEIPIRYKSVPFVLTHTKFGFGIKSNKHDAATKANAHAAMECIHKAIPFAEEAMQPMIQEHVERGAITLRNHHQRVRDRYLFFRKKAALEFKKIKKKSNQKLYFPSDSSSYYTTSMIDAYFSLLEHLLVLLFPFAIKVNHSSFNVEDLIRANWKTKYEIIFPHKEGSRATIFLQHLETIKEEFRNPQAHGYFLREGNSFLLHMEDVGLIPLVMTNTRKKVNYSFLGPSQMSFSLMCSILDRFDKYLLTSKTTKYGMLFIQRGIDIAFDPQSINRYKLASRSKELFENFIEELEMMITNAENMDW